MCQNTANLNLSRGRLVTPLVAFFLTVAVYWHAVGLGFVSWDDGMNFTGNRYIDAFTFRHFLFFWRHPFAGVYMPVSYNTIGLLSLIARGPDCVLSPTPFHAFNVIVHAVNVVLVYFLLHRFAKNGLAALGGALLFALHPMQVESVAWASDLVRILSTFWGLVALLLYVRHADTGCRGWFAGAVVCGVLSLLSKPGLVTLPLIALVIDVWFLGRMWKQALLLAAGWVLLSLPAIAIALGAEPPDMPTPLLERPIVMLDSFGFYLAKFFWPSPLCVEYARTPQFLAISASGAELTCTLFVVAVAWVWHWRRRAPWLAGASLISLFALLPTSGLVPFIYQDYSTVADRYAYVAVLGPAIASMFLLARLERRAALAIVCIIAALLSPLTIRQIHAWDSSLSLYEQAVKVSPCSFTSHMMLGFALLDAGQADSANEQAQIAVSLRPNDGKGYEVRAASEVALGHINQAMADYGEDIRLLPKSPNAYHALGMILIRLGRKDEGLGLFRQALRIDPRDPVLHADFATALARCGRLDEALAEFRIAVRLDPDHRPSRINLTTICAALGRYDDVAEQSRWLIHLNPRDELAHANLGTALLALGHPQEAQGEFREALSLVPSDASARDGLAAARR